MTGDFSAEVRIAGDYFALYDQSGLMLRADESHWIKTGIELNAAHIDDPLLAVGGNSVFLKGFLPVC